MEGEEILRYCSLKAMQLVLFCVLLMVLWKSQALSTLLKALLRVTI